MSRPKSKICSKMLCTSTIPCKRGNFSKLFNKRVVTMFRTKVRTMKCTVTRKFAWKCVIKLSCTVEGGKFKLCDDAFYVIKM